MSEPVGNSPRRDAIPNNSHTERKAKEPAAPVEEREPAQKIIQGDVTARKPAWWRRAGRSIFAEDISSMGQFVMGDLIIPTIRNALYEIGTGALSRSIWGSKAGPIRPGGVVRGNAVGGSVIGTRYDRMAEGNRVISREAQAKHDFNDVIFPDRDEALIVLEALINRIARYRAATVADLYDYAGYTGGGFPDRNFGWTDLNTATVRQRYGGWLLDLPQPEPLGK